MELTIYERLLLNKEKLICPLCKVRLPHPQHALAKIYFCRCGGEVHHLSSGVFVCERCRKRVPPSSLRGHKFKVICPMQFGVEVRRD